MSDYLWGETVSAAKKVADKYGCKPQHLLAVAEVESRCDPGLRNQPLIRVERHYFKRYASASQYSKAFNAGLLKNARRQRDRHANLRKLEAINRAAAYKSHSWGLMQVMGANYEMLGYPSAEALVIRARSGPEGQFDIGALFMAKAGILDDLVAGRLEAFATRYNGPNWRQNDYVNKLKKALAKHKDVTIPAPMSPSPVEPKPPVPPSAWGGIISAILAALTAIWAWVSS